MCFIKPYVLIKALYLDNLSFFSQHQLLTRSVMKHTKYPKYQNSTSGDVEYQKSRKFSNAQDLCRRKFHPCVMLPNISLLPYQTLGGNRPE